VVHSPLRPDARQHIASYRLAAGIVRFGSRTVLRYRYLLDQMDHGGPVGSSGSPRVQRSSEASLGFKRNLNRSDNSRLVNGPELKEQFMLERVVRKRDFVPCCTSPTLGRHSRLFRTAETRNQVARLEDLDPAVSTAWPLVVYCFGVRPSTGAAASGHVYAPPRPSLKASRKSARFCSSAGLLAM
jgi:hypothetical protein